MLVVVQLHDRRADVRLECCVVVGELGERVVGHVLFFLSALSRRFSAQREVTDTHPSERQRRAQGVASPHDVLYPSRAASDREDQSSSAGRHGGIRARDAVLLGALVGHRQQAADAAGDGVLRERRIGVVAELVEARIAVREAKLAGLPQVLGHLVAEDLERALDARAGGDRGLGGAAQVRVVEVDEAVHAGAHLAALAQLVPLGGRALGAHVRRARADGLPVAHDDAGHSAHFARLGGDADAVRGADERHRRFRRGAGDLESGRSAGLAERAAREERSAPDRREVGA